MKVQTLWWLLVPLFFISLLVSIAVGAVEISLAELVNILKNILPGFSQSTDSLAQRIVVDIRLPRVLLVSCVGCLLAMSGTVTQGLFRNPLADPSLIGVTAGASAGAGTAIVLSDSLQWLTFTSELGSMTLVSLGAFTGGVITVWLVYRLATSSRGTSVPTMLLAGIAITALAGSYSGLLEYIADNTMLRRISLWRMGGFGGATYQHVFFAASVALVFIAVLPRHAQSLNALLLGESEARHLGVDVQRLKLVLIFWVSLAVGVSVALAGAIAFVGLLVPHLVRLLIGPDHKYLIPLSAMVGALLLVLADLLARTLVAPSELPVGIITAALGAPFFISLLRHRSAYGWE